MTESEDTPKPDLRLVRITSSHPESLPGGRTAEPGEEVEIDLADPEAKRLVDDGAAMILSQKGRGGSK